MKSFKVNLALICSLVFTLCFAWVCLAASALAWRNEVTERAVELIDREQLSAAIRYLEAAEAPWWLNFIPLGEDANLNTWLSAVRQVVTTGLNDDASPALHKLAAEREQTKTEHQQLLQTLARVKSRYQLLAAGTSELFHLELVDDAQMNADSTADFQPHFFERGLLAGLPVMRGVADGLNTLPELSAAIKTAGGVVTVQEFAQSLDQLTREGLDVRDTVKSLNQDLQTTIQREGELEKKQIQAKMRSLQQLAAKIEDNH